jgi:hypothetical protein
MKRNKNIRFAVLKLVVIEIFSTLRRNKIYLKVIKRVRNGGA